MTATAPEASPSSPAGWRKSSRSDAGNCVEAGNGPCAVLVRDTTDRGGPVLAFTAGAWAAFTAGISGAAR